MSNPHLALYLLIQLAVILGACQLVGMVARRLGQPQVVAEMLAGIVLGPSVLGLFWPDLQAQLFPKETMKVIFPIAQLALATYMFVVGLEFRVDLVRDRLRSSAAVSIAGMITPFLLGGALAWYFFHHTSFFPAKVSLTAAMLFVGASMCITAFPVLARLIQHKKLTGTAMGAISLGAGAINDAAAWCLLTFVLASMDGDFSHVMLNLGGGVGYVCVALLVVRPLLARWARGIEVRARISDGEFTACLVLLALGAWFTEWIGLHAVFGAFVMGVAMPRGLVTSTLIARVQPLTVALLLPLFFTYSGLNTQMGLLDSTYMWGMCGLVLVVAIGGKGIACWLAARTTGVSNREALGIGTLMNVRGLMELIIINIGLERGVITPALFATLVIMAVVTTVMASPIFDWLVGKYAVSAESADTQEV